MLTESETPEARSEWQIVGLGAYISSDDEIGLALVRSLSQDSGFAKRCVLLESADAATVASSVIEWGRPLILVDAADMDLPPGSIRRIPEERLSDPFLFTTHTLPLTFLIEALGEFVPQVEFLGIQPDVVAFGFPMSPSVRNAVEQVYLSLKSGEESWDCL